MLNNDKLIFKDFEQKISSPESFQSPHEVQSPLNPSFGALPHLAF